MERTQINNLGMAPLAGICSYEEACRTGYAIDHNVQLLKRYSYIEAQLNQVFAAHLARTPEWEAKCAFSYHLYLDAEHSALIRKRIAEMRQPPLNLDKVPDPKLEMFISEVICSETTLELLVAIYDVVKPELMRCYKKHLAETNRLMDQPTCRIIKIMLAEEEEMITWGQQAIRAFTAAEKDAAAAQLWKTHLQGFLHNAGGIAGDLEASTLSALPIPRSEGEPYEMDVVPRRDARFKDVFNRSATLDEYYRDETLDWDERTYALIYKRLREMDVPEWMGPILYKTKGKPWEYYIDLSRQLYDEARHSMMGEVGLYQNGVPFYKYPIDLKASSSLNTDFTPLESHIILWGIEQGLMAKDTGKRWEWLITNEARNELAMTIQDYDWADEVLHAQIGRKWLIPAVGSLEEIQTIYNDLWQKAIKSKEKYIALSNQERWWPEFLEEMRQGWEKLIQGSF